MRNLKRVLSLVMAVAMLIGLMVVSASAASTYDNFTDKDEIVNKEAVNTMVSLGVINGKEDGSYFDPAGIVTRAEMAKLIAVTLNGGKDPLLGTGAVTTQFSDVASNYWAAPYIAYCANLGIINGKGDGTFGPEEAVTGTAAAKMMLTALGYRADIEGLTGTGWDLNTDSLANKVGLYDDMSIVPSNGLSRDNTAQLIYNGVQADEVEYRNNYGEYSGVIYAQPINGTGANAEPSTLLYTRFNVVKVEGVVVANDVMAIDDQGTTVAGKTRLTDIYVGGTHRVETVNNQERLLSEVYPVAMDNSYLGQRVVLYVKGLKNLAPNAASTQVVSEPIISADNTVAVTSKRMKDADAVRSFLSDNSLSLPANGVDFSAVTGTVFYSENDTEINEQALNRTFAVTAAPNVNGTEYTFIDHNGDGVVDYIFGLKPKMAKVTVYDENAETLTIAGEGAIDFDDIANYKDVAKDDIVLYYLMNETYYLAKAETVSGKVESYDNNNKTVTVDGTSYGASTVSAELASTDMDDFSAGMPMVGNTYTFYLDFSGNVVSWVLGEETLGKYALVLASDDGGSNVVTKGEIKLLLSDGTVATGDVNLLASANKFGLAPNGTTGDKEQAMANMLGANMSNRIVTYVIGENGSITIGDPARVSNYASVTDGQNNYTIAAANVARSTARYSFTNTDATKNGSVSVNDSTIFFVRNMSGNGNTYSVVNGLSNLPTTAMKSVLDDPATLADESVPATVESIVYSSTRANPNVAKAVLIDADFAGTASYVYLKNSYTGTVDVNGQEVYTYPVIFEDGTSGTLNADSTGYAKGQVYEYTVDADGVATLSRPAPTASKGGVVNGMVTTYAKGSNLSVRPGEDANAATTSYTVLSDANLWNVEGSTSYKETLTNDMTVAFVVDSDGFVKTVFVKDTSVTVGQAVSEVNGAGVLYNNVFSGFNAQFGPFTANADIYYSYTVLMNNGKTETYTNKQGTTNKDTGYLEIGMPKNATSLTLTYASLTGQGGGQTGNVETGLEGSAASISNVTVASNGNLSATLNYTAPDFAVKNATANFNVEVYADGAYYDTINVNKAMSDGKLAVTLRDSGYPSDQKLTFKIVDETFNNVVVNYVDEDGNAFTALDAASATTTTGGSLKVAVSDTAYTGTFDVTAIDGATTSTSLPVNPVGVGSTGTTLASVVIAGNKAVTITIDTTNLVVKPVEYTINALSATALSGLNYTGSLSSTAQAYTLAIAGQKTTFGQDETIVLTATLSTALPATETVGLKVTATVCGQTAVFNFKNDGTQATATAQVKATADDTITATDLVFSDITAPVITGATAVDMDGDGQFSSGDVITVTFSEAIAAGSGKFENAAVSVTGASANSATVTVAVAADGMSATLTIAAADPNGADADITIAVNKMVSVATGVSNANSYTIAIGKGEWTTAPEVVKAP